MKKPLQTFFHFPVFSTLFILGFTACGPSPESAAQQVCDCIQKAKDSKGFVETMSSSAACGQLHQKNLQKFDGDDLVDYTKKATECTLSGLLK